MQSGKSFLSPLMTNLQKWRGKSLKHSNGWLTKSGVPEQYSTTAFECPHCHRNTTLPHDADTGSCEVCGKPIYITDWLGFHQEMGEDSAPEGIATTYMNIHETLLLFTAIRHYWLHKKNILSECLFVKDGPSLSPCSVLQTR